MQANGLHAPAVLSQGKNPGTKWTGRFMDSATSQDVFLDNKTSHHRDSNFGPSIPVETSQYRLRTMFFFVHLLLSTRVLPPGYATGYLHCVYLL
jgi:hypothetical protein